MKKRLTAILLVLCLALGLLPGEALALSEQPEDVPWPELPAEWIDAEWSEDDDTLPVMGELFEHQPVEAQPTDSANPVPEFVPGVLPEAEELRYPDYGEWATLADSLPSGWTTQAIQSPVENQGVNGLCWAFGTYAAMTAQMNTIDYLNGYTESKWNLSELHMAHCLSNWDGNTKEGNNRPPNEGGNREIAASYLMRDTYLSGAVLEAEDPFYRYPDIDYINNKVLSRDLNISRVKQKTMQAQNILFLTGARDEAAFSVIKQAVSTYGGVGAALFWKDQTTAANGAAVQEYYNERYAAYCYNYWVDLGREGCAAGTDETNHVVEIVGWNDTFPRERFNAIARPQRDGAWLIKNSWGTDWGNQGYGWVSYEDTNFPICAFCFSGVSSYDPRTVVYETDFINNGEAWGSDTATERYLAKVFTKKTDEPEILDSIRIFVASPFLSIEAGWISGADLRSGRPQQFQAWGGVGTNQNMPVSCPGWYTISMRNAAGYSPLINGRAGEEFSIAIRIRAPYGGKGIYVGFDSTNGYGGSPIYWSPDGRYWYPDDRVNYCIKAVTYPESAQGRSQVLVDKAADSLLWPLIQVDGTTKLNLPRSYRGANLTWSSSDEDAVSTSNGMVYGARFDKSSAVTLTAAVAWGEEGWNGTAQRNVTFNLNVHKRTATYNDKIAAAEDWWTYEHWWEAIKGQNTDFYQVRTDLTIPSFITVSPENCEPYQLRLFNTAGAVKDITTEWEYVSSTGKVTRPAYGQPDSLGFFRLILCNEAGAAYRYLTSWQLKVLAYKGAITAGRLPDMTASTEQGATLWATASTEGFPGSLQYQWYQADNANMVNAKKIDGATADRLHVYPSASTTSTSYYCCVISALDAAPVQTNTAKVTLISGYPTARLASNYKVQLYNANLPGNAEVFAARYDDNGRMVEIVKAGWVDGDTTSDYIFFSSAVGAGWKLFCLDGNNKPLCVATIIN